MGDDALIPLRLFHNGVFSRLGGSVRDRHWHVRRTGLLPLYLQIVKGASPTESGLLCCR